MVEYYFIVFLWYFNDNMFLKYFFLVFSGGVIFMGLFKNDFLQFKYFLEGYNIYVKEKDIRYLLNILLKGY